MIFTTFLTVSALSLLCFVFVYGERSRKRSYEGFYTWRKELGL